MSYRSPALLAAHHRALRCLAHPASLAAIVLLLANDHWLKQAHPSALTGKLSDLAGLLFFPFLLAFCLAWLPGLGRDEVRLGRLSIAITALWFAGLQLSPLVEASTMRLVGLISGRDGVNVRDATDLVALAMLWPAWRIWVKEGRGGRQRAPVGRPREIPDIGSRTRTVLKALALLVAAFATAATSPPPEPEVRQLFEQGERICTDSVNFEDHLWTVACSQDGGSTWQPAPEVELPTDPQRLFSSGAVCAPPDDRICYRAAGPEQIEISQDGGASWALAWSIPESRKGFRERIVAPPLYFMLYFSHFAPGPHAMALIGDADSHRLIVANGSEGVVLRDPAGSWSQRPVGDLRPLPLSANRGEDLDLLFLTLIPESLVAGWVAGMLITLSLLAGWPALARAEAGMESPEDGRRRAPPWIWLMAPLGTALAFAISHWFYIAILPVLVLSALKGDYGIFGQLQALAGLGLTLAALAYSVRHRRHNAARRRDAGARLNWLRGGLGSGLLGFGAVYLPFAAWALGWIDQYRNAVFIAVVLSLCLVVYMIVFLRSRMSAMDT